MKVEKKVRNAQEKEKRVILATGGTGGHIYPAVVVAHFIKKHFPQWSILVLGAQGSVMEEILTKEKLPFATVAVKGLKGKSFTQLLKNLFILPVGIIKALMITNKFKPHLVMGFGGYPSAPGVLSAFILRIPFIIIEQNVYPGLANRIFCRFSKAAAVSFEESKGLLKGRVEITGNPVREDFHRIRPSLKGITVDLLIFGGSQGAHTINLLMQSTLPYLKKHKEHLKILHQSGKKDLELVEKAYKQERFNARVVPYIHNMVEEFQKAHLIICRAGASTIAELAAAGKASILLPLARSADGHQNLNAKSFAQQGAAIVLWGNITGEQLAREIIKVIEKPERIMEMGKAARKMAKPEAAQKIVNLALEIMKKQRGEK
jgi:UDP-N-acetylglucosamine--N-acetylmuramyl-(pentapeptide) pyrophosphoryl-undecaprenol N-acetylglucosamine transferase